MNRNRFKPSSLLVARRQIPAMSVALIGGVVLARAVQNEQFSEEILKSVRQK